MTRRFNPKNTPPDTYWADAIAAQIIAESPEQELYTCAAGISPSGIVHFGNFRDVATSYAVVRALEKAGKKARVIFSWDNFDRFRKVPAGIPESWSEHIGKPLSDIPDPFPCHTSYAEHFQADFEKAMQVLDIPLTFISQAKEHEGGRYDADIVYALNHREEIADILLSFMSEKAKGEKGINPDAYRKEYFPVSVYSRFTGKDLTKILSFDGTSMLTYRCIETGNEDTIDITKDHRVKLSWKIDWPMRWRAEGVVFEPGGHDHASPGGSYDTSSVIAQKIFGILPPVFAEYKFVGIRGGGSKMSGSKGGAVSPLQLLEIYEPSLIKWLYMRRSPDQAFELAFDSEIYRQYDEFDRITKATEHDKATTRALEDVCGATKHYENPIPFRQAVAYGQIVQWNTEKLAELLAGIDASYDPASINARISKARAWLETYNREEMIALNETPHTTYIQTLPEEDRANIRALRTALQKNYEQIADLETLVYSIPKKTDATDDENKKLQRAFFTHLYQLLIQKDTGPRLSTFLWALPREKVLALLEC